MKINSYWVIKENFRDVNILIEPKKIGENVKRKVDKGIASSKIQTQDSLGATVNTESVG